MWETDSLSAVKQTKGKIMSVDFGDVRTGLAVSDLSRLIASGIGYISPGGIEKTADAVAEAVKEQSAVAVVVGLPVNMDGSRGGRAQRCEKFAVLLKERLGESIPVCLFDERMTTMIAYRYLGETSTFGKARKSAVDTLSAEIILQGYIDRERAAKK